jgi:hypothetical protein
MAAFIAQALPLVHCTHAAARFMLIQPYIRGSERAERRIYKAVFDF